MVNTIKDSIQTRKIGFLVADGVDAATVETVKSALEAAGAVVEIIAPHLGEIIAADNSAIPVQKSLLTASSVFYDALYVPAGVTSSATLEADADAVHFLNEAYRHCKAIAAHADARQVLEATYFAKKLPEDDSEESAMMEGIVIQKDVKKLAKIFIRAIAQHRFWEREKPRRVPA
nr:DJ-1/PfpI family protein [Chitinophaga pinensis]